jgi:hypothetical protein
MKRGDRAGNHKVLYSASLRSNGAGRSERTRRSEANKRPIVLASEHLSMHNEACKEHKLESKPATRKDATNRNMNMDILSGLIDVKIALI